MLSLGPYPYDWMNKLLPRIGNFTRQIRASTNRPSDGDAMFKLVLNFKGRSPWSSTTVGKVRSGCTHDGREPSTEPIA